MNVSWKVDGKPVVQLLVARYPGLEGQALDTACGVLGLCLWYSALRQKAEVGAAFRAYDLMEGQRAGTAKAILRAEAKRRKLHTSDPFIWMIDMVKEVGGDENRVSVTAGD